MIRHKQSIPKEKYEVTGTQLLSIPIDSIRPNPYQPRKHFSKGSLDELTQSLLEYGQLQPINVRRKGHNEYELVAGERRLRAARNAGWVFIDAIVISAYEQDSAMIALIENLQRENLHFLEEAEGFNNLLKDHGMTQDELARRIGKNQSTIANKLRLLKLPLGIKGAVMEMELTERHARALLRLSDEESQSKVIRVISEKHLSVKATEDLVESILKKNGIHDKKKSPANIIRVFRDYRLFLNSIKNTVSQMCQAGIEANYEMTDMDSEYRIMITISKSGA